MPKNEKEQTITVHVPVNLRKWGCKKIIISPSGHDLRKLKKELRNDDKLLKAIGRAYKWQKWIDTGKYLNSDEISDIEDINRSYVSRVMRLMRLSPKIINAILDGKQPDGFGLSSVYKSFPALWSGLRLDRRSYKTSKN